MKPITVISGLLVFSIALVVFADPAVAEVELRGGAAYNDNVLRTDTNEQSETILFTGLILDLEDESTRYESRIRSDIEYRHYVEDTVDDELVGRLGAELTFRIVPSVFEWIVKDDFGDVQTDPFLAYTSNNREYVNSFSTGPDLRLAISSTFAVEAAGRYTTRNFEDSDVDSDVTGAQLALVKALSPRRKISFVALSNRTEFDDSAINPKFQNEAFYLGFESQISRGSIKVNLGVNEIERNNVTSDGEYLDIAVSRELTASSALDIGISQSYTDRGGEFAQFGDVVRLAGGTLAGGGVGDPYENQTVYATWNFDRRGRTLSLSYLHNDKDYVEQNAFDRQRRQIYASVNVPLAVTWQVNASAAIGRTDFDTGGRQDDDLRLTAGVSHRLSSALRLDLQFRREERESNTALFDYTENVVSLSVSYTR